MKYCLITFRSVTPAQRAESALKRAGILCHVRRTPHRIEEQGCGYGIQLKCDELRRALSLLQKNDIGYRKVYTMQPSGRAEERQL